MFNVCINSIVVLITSVLVFVLGRLNLKDAFLISLSAVFIACGVIQFILGFISPPSFTDNWHLMVMIIILVFEVVLLTISKYVSLTVK